MLIPESRAWCFRPVRPVQLISVADVYASTDVDGAIFLPAYRPAPASSRRHQPTPPRMIEKASGPSVTCRYAAHHCRADKSYSTVDNQLDNPLSLAR